MSSGHRGGHRFTGHEDAELHTMLDNKQFAAALQAFKTGDYSYDIPFLAGSDNSGTKIYADRDFYAAVKAGKVKYNGKPFDPMPFIGVHEKIENVLIRHLGWDFPRAHDLATVAERHAVEHVGMNWNKYQDSLKPFIKTAGAEKAMGKTPPDLLEVPYVGSPQDREVKAGERGQPQSFTVPAHHPILKQARRSPKDGQFYVPDPVRRGKFMQVR